LVATSGGNPLFLTELVGSAGAELPDTVEALFAGRIDALRPEQRRTLRAAAVLGASFGLDALNAVLDEEVPASALSSDLANFVEVSGETAAFRHRLVRDVAYEGLPYRRRRELHRKVAEWMVLTPDPQPELLAVHYDAAGAAQEAWTWSLSAAERAERAMAHGTAAAFFGRAIDAARKVEGVDRTTLACVHRARGEAAMMAGRLEEARGAFARARRLLPGAPAPLAEVHFLEGFLREQLGDLKGALRWYGSASRLLEGSWISWERPFFLPVQYGDAGWLRTRSLLGRASTRYRSGRLHPARGDAEAALAEARKRNDVGGQAHALNLLHLIYTALRLPQPEPFAEQAIVLFEQVGDQTELANVLNNMGMACHVNGDWDAAADYYEQSARAQEAAGQVLNSAAVANNRAEILLDQGRLDAAEHLLTDAITTFEAAGHWFAVAALMNLATAVARRGRTAEAYALVDDAIEKAQRLSMNVYVVEGQVRRAEIALLAGDDLTARACLAEAGAEGRSSLRARRLQALLLARAGEVSAARGALAELSADAGATGEPFEQLLALRALASVTAAGERTAAEAESDRLQSLLGIVDVDVALPRGLAPTS
jgi:tetratricopeptide (TPR) repeat protein